MFKGTFKNNFLSPGVRCETLDQNYNSTFQGVFKQLFRVLGMCMKLASGNKSMYRGVFKQ